MADLRIGKSRAILIMPRLRALRVSLSLRRRPCVTLHGAALSWALHDPFIEELADRATGKPHDITQHLLGVLAKLRRGLRLGAPMAAELRRVARHRKTPQTGLIYH